MVRFLILLILIKTIESAKILAVFPTPSISHQVVFRPLVQELLKRGHEMVVVTPDPMYQKGKLPSNLTEIDVHDIAYKVWAEEYYKFKVGNPDDLYYHSEIAFRLFAKVFEVQYLSEDFQRLANGSHRFDLLLLEACVRPTLALSHIFKAPVIQISSFGAMFGMYERVGAPTHPLLYPSVIHKRLSNLTVWEKVQEIYHHFKIANLYEYMESEENEMLKRVVGPDVPPLSKLSDNIDMIFLNVHPTWNNNQPIPPNVVYIGGIHQAPQKELPQDLKTYLDSSKHGVIYVSFGTNVKPSQIPHDKLNSMFEVFRTLKYDILWKWDENEMPGRPNNVKISKWLPQMDILRHPKVKLFVTQGGLQSSQEAILAGVPLVGIPAVGDQWYNVEKYTCYKIGVKLTMKSLTASSFKEAILSVMEDESFHNNIVQLRSTMYDQPQSPLERAVWWTEHVLRHGGAKHLRAPAANMPWTQYYELGLISLIAASVIPPILIIFYLITRALLNIFQYVITLSSVKSKKL